MTFTPTEMPQRTEMPDAVELLIKEAHAASRRRRMRWVIVFVAVALVTSLVVASSVGRSQPSKQVGSGSNRPRSSALALAPCASSSVSIANGPYVGGAMEENAHSLMITNAGSRSCLMSGFPRLVVYGTSGDVFRFALVHHATGGYPMTSKVHKPFALAPHKSAFVFFAQTACEAGTETGFSDVALILPKSTQPTEVVTLQNPIAHCVGQSASYANPIAISPVEPTVRATEKFRQ
jgi:hypothetical protein